MLTVKQLQWSSMGQIIHCDNTEKSQWFENTDLTHSMLS